MDIEITSRSVDEIIEKICKKRRHFNENRGMVQVPNNVATFIVALKRKNISLETWRLIAVIFGVFL